MNRLQMNYTHLLIPSENLEQAFAINHEGRLTERQISRLRQMVVPPGKNIEVWAQSAKQHKQRFGLACVTTLATLGLVGLNQSVQPQSSHWSIITFLIALFPLTMMVSTYTLWQQAQEDLHFALDIQQEKQMHWANSIHSMLPVGYVEGLGGFLVRNDQGQVGEMVHVGGRNFAISHALWQELKMMGGRFGAHYISDTPHGDILLSIQPIVDLEAQHAELAQVVGVGDDGELIYAAELVDDVLETDSSNLPG
ncbi:MAG: hypothetical protein SF123_16665 [Chloroflexota bacterium]|nr:hypothetical protein [Chloroflexota bacterium]